MSALSDVSGNIGITNLLIHLHNYELTYAYTYELANLRCNLLSMNPKKYFQNAFSPCCIFPYGLLSSPFLLLKIK